MNTELINDLIDWPMVATVILTATALFRLLDAHLAARHGWLQDADGDTLVRHLLQQGHRNTASLRGMDRPALAAAAAEWLRKHHWTSRYRAHIVFGWALLVGAGFWVMEVEILEARRPDFIYTVLVSYSVSTSFYELIIKHVDRKVRELFGNG